jgi:hypothetical protein
LDCHPSTQRAGLVAWKRSSDIPEARNIHVHTFETAEFVEYHPYRLNARMSVKDLMKDGYFRENAAYLCSRTWESLKPVCVLIMPTKGSVFARRQHTFLDTRFTEPDSRCISTHQRAYHLALTTLRT